MRLLSWRRWVYLAVLAGAALTIGSSAADAQYFGRNKIQYENLDFEILETEHFDIYYYAEEEPALKFVALMAERWYARLSRLLEHDLSNRQALIIYASAPHFRQTNTLQGELGEATGGVTEILKRRIVLPLAGPLAETDHVLGHELVHAFQFDITGEGGGIALAGIPAVMRYPLWFTEGMAEYLSIGPVDPNTAMWMRDAVREELPDIAKLSDPRFFPYRYGQALWSYVAGRWGDDVVGRILKASRTSGNPSQAFARILRASPDTVVADWHRATREHFAPIRQQTGDPGDYGRLLIAKELGGGSLNIAPVLSPDGSQIVFISEKGLFAIDMYLANVATGETIRKVTRNDVDPHFESIQFIYSAGAWDRDGRRFVFSAVSKGRPMLSILDIEKGTIEREIRIKEVGEILNPTWSPDGRYLAFSALANGLTDLFVYDLEDDELRRLTDDPYTDLQPAWSPDGDWIAFVTDRFSAGITSLLHGNYRLALIDPKTGLTQAVTGFGNGKHINPQWSPDGGSLYFISDQNGISNIYRVVVESGELFQLTNLYTGVSGIAALSPALTVATETGEIAVSVFENDVHSIWLIDSPDVLVGGPVLPPFEDVDPTVLPPGDRASSDVVALLANPFFGLPDDTVDFVMRDYHPKFGLDYIAQPSLAIGVGQFGTFVAGGASLFWSDMLGGHQLATTLQVNGGVRDIAVLVGYTNLNKRLNWGVTVAQTPYRFGTASPAVQGTLPDGTPAFQQEVTTFRQTTRQVSGAIAYPLNRSQRIEAQAGVLNISYDTEIRTTIFDLGGNLLADDKRQVASFPTLNLGQASMALVYDNSFFGSTSPVLGQRYRLQMGVTAGSIRMYTGLVDYRKYIMPVRPFTLAFRFVHNGRYGRDADNGTQIQPYYIGFDGLIRGYGFGSFDFFTECESLTNCSNYTNLFGSKIILTNLELRFPPLAFLGGGAGLFGFLPIEAVIFGDAGLAYWGIDEAPQGYESGESDKAFFLGGDRRPVYSAGAGIRMNIFGIFIMELDYVYPFNRRRGGHLQFGFTPGF